jgi:hypothetical protein
MAWDESKSAEIKNIPKIPAQTLDSILTIARRRGGEIGFVSINEQTPQLCRIKFTAEQGTAEKILSARTRNDEQIVRIIQSVYRSLRERTAQRTRLFDSLETLLFFLKEPHHDPAAQKVLFIISDFEEAWRPKNKCHPLLLPSDATAITIGAHPDSVAQVLQGKVYIYTTPDGVIDFLKMEELP